MEPTEGLRKEDRRLLSICPKDNSSDTNKNKGPLGNADCVPGTGLGTYMCVFLSLPNSPERWGLIPYFLAIRKLRSER